MKDNFLKNGFVQDPTERGHSRRGIIKVNKIQRNYGFIPPFVVEGYSSGEESDIEDEKLNEATVRDVCGFMIDYNTIMVMVSIDYLHRKTMMNYPEMQDLLFCSLTLMIG